MRMLISGSGCLFLLAVALLPPGEFRLALAALTTGLAPMALSRRRWTPVAFACAAIIIGLPVWGLSALAAWGLSIPALLPWLPLGISLIAAAISFRISAPIKISRFALPDGLALGFIGLVAIPLIAGWMTNGPSGQGDNAIFKAGPGVSGDTFYHMGLIQESLNRHAWPDENPVFAGAPNRYPALIHVSLASLASLSSGPAALTLWPIFPLYLLAGVGLLFSAIWKLSRARTHFQIGILALFFLAAVIIRIDHFVLLQAQALTFGLVGLMLYYTPRFPRKYTWQWIHFSAILLLLISSHTVSALVGIILSWGLCAMLMLRKRWKQFASAGFCTAFLCVSLTLMNYYPAQPIIEGPLPEGFTRDSFQIMVIPYLVPLTICLLMAMRQRPLSGFAIATLLLVLASAFYFATGYSARSYNKAFFALFNAPRFGVFALLLVIPFINVKRRFEQTLAFVLLLHNFLLPNGPQEMLFTQLFGKTTDYKQRDIELLNRNRGNSNQAILTIGSDLALSAFSGKPLYISPVSYSAYALDTIDERESVRRLQDQVAFFSTMAPADRITYMRTNHIDTVALKLTPESNPADFLPSEKVTVTKGADWTLFLLKSLPPTDLPKNSNSH